MRPRVLQITDAATLSVRDLFERITAVAALAPEARRRFAVQLRDPGLPACALLELGERLRVETARAGSALVVNDRLDLALALGADGVHLGRRSVTVGDARALLPGAWISVACHTVADVARAAVEGADAAVLSPIFASPGKGPPIGVEAITEARRVAGTLSIVALGGVDRAGARACFAAGAHAVASIRADLAALLLDA